MSSKLITPPSVYPVSLEDVKRNASVWSAEDDAWIKETLIPTATEYVESRGGVALISQQRLMTFDKLPSCIHVDRPPLIQVDELAYTDTSGAAATVDINADIRVDANSRPGRITPALGKSWPATAAVIAAATLTYTCGFGAEPADVPAQWKQAITLLASYWLNHREAFESGGVAGNTALSLNNLIANAGRLVRYA